MSFNSTGEALIGGVAVKASGASFEAWDPAARAHIAPSFQTVDADQIDQACRLAAAAFDTYRATTDAQRADFLDTIAEQILAIGDDLIVRAMTESGLPRVRLEGERGRTVGQLKLFAGLLREGSWTDARLDTALPDRTPPRPDLRLRMIGLGPVAVFGASNFPLAFSVAGGDTASALAARGAAIAAGFAGSLTMGVGQFCTNPGLVLGLEGPEFTAFAAAAAEALAPAPAATMLTAGIASSYVKGVANLAQHADVKPLLQNTGEEGKGAAALFVTSGEAFLAKHDLRDEVFGPVSLLVACRDIAQLVEITESLEGQLTATLQMDQGDLEDARRLLPALERRVGRILANGFPTGVEVSTAMVHGGPFPATSDGRSTSVGTAAINRFLRPVSYQNLLQDLLPESLRDGNPLGIWRRKDGVLGKE